MRRVVFVGLILLMLLARPGLAAQEFLPLIGDTWLNIDSTNYSTHLHLKTYTYPVGRVANVAILKWDLSPIHSGATINHATLSLYLQDWRGALPYHVRVHRILNFNPVITATTGQTYDGTNGWTANNCCSGGVPLAQADIDHAVSQVGVSEVLGYRAWHVTSVVQQWVNTPGTALGLLVNADHSAAVDNYRYFASNESYTDRRPLLEVNFSTGAPPTESHRSVTLRWDDNSDNEDGFYIERRQYPPTGAFVRAHTTAAQVVTWLDVFDVNEERCYRVQAFNTAGTSAYTSEACACRNFVCGTIGVIARPAVTSRPPVTSRPAVP